MTTANTISKQRQRNWAWVWVAYTGFLFIDPLFNPSLRLWVATLAVFAVFLAIYVAFVRASDHAHPARYWMIAATFVLGLLTFPWNAGASTFFIYAAAFLPFTVKSIRTVVSLFVAESLIILAEGYYFSAPGRLFHIHWPNV